MTRISVKIHHQLQKHNLAHELRERSEQVATINKGYESRLIMEETLLLGRLTWLTWLMDRLCVCQLI